MAIETNNAGLLFGDTSTGSFYNEILNTLFKPAVADTVINPNTLLKRLRRDPDAVEGKAISFPIHYDTANGVTALGADGTLPDSDIERYLRYLFFVRFMYVRIRFDGLTQHATRSQLASWLKGLESETKAKAVNLARFRQRAYHNDGSGRLCEMVSPTGGAFAASTAYTVRINQGIESPATCVTAPTKFLKAGMPIAIFTSGGTLKGFGTVGSIGSSTVFTTGTSVAGVASTIAAGDWIVTAAAVMAGAAKDTGFKNEPMGIAGVFSDADPSDGTATGFQGVASASNSWHQANIKANGDVLRPVTLALLDEAYTTSMEIGDTTPTVMIGSFPIVRKVAQLLMAERSFYSTGAKLSMDGGYDDIHMHGTPLIADRDCYNNRLYLADESDISLAVMADPQWMDMDGSVYHRMNDKDAYQATMYCHETMAITTRDKQTLITDLQE